MPEIKTVGIKELKNNLSAYLRDVRRGVRVLVSDRSTVVAELHEPQATYMVQGGDNPVLREWVEEGIVRLPVRDKEPMPPPIVHLEDGTAARLLDADRGD
jgi:antitoxin (DNA-binding transcriptional repressor) of toxin-antitoxin stability system